VNLAEIRIEEVTEIGDGLWYFDVSKFRDQHGPGKASRSEPVEGFKFEDGEMFCEETACLFNENNGHILVQYNHHGARAGMIQDYLNAYVDGLSFQFELRPKYDDSIQAKFNNRVATKKITFKLDSRLLTDEDRRSGTSLAQAAQLGADLGGESIELTISAGKKKGGALSKIIDNTLDLLLRKHAADNNSVTKLKVGVLENLDSRMEVLDLLEQRLTHTFPNMLKGEDLRFPRQARYDALKKVNHVWKRKLTG
jgi:hypothetical protein